STIKCSELREFDEAGRTHTATDAHRHDTILQLLARFLAAARLEQDVADAARAGHAEGVADGDGAAIDVVLLGVNAKTVARIEALAREGFVQLPEVDVVDLEAVTLEEARHGEDRADAHLVGLATGDREAAEDAEDVLVALLGFLA